MELNYQKETFLRTLLHLNSLRSIEQARQNQTTPSPPVFVAPTLGTPSGAPDSPEGDSLSRAFPSKQVSLAPLSPGLAILDRIVIF